MHTDTKISHHYRPSRAHKHTHTYTPYFVEVLNFVLGQCQFPFVSAIIIRQRSPGTERGISPAVKKKIQILCTAAAYTRQFGTYLIQDPQWNGHTNYLYTTNNNIDASLVFPVSIKLPILPTTFFWSLPTN